MFLLKHCAVQSGTLSHFDSTAFLQSCKFTLISDLYVCLVRTAAAAGKFKFEESKESYYFENSLLLTDGEES